MIVDRMLALYFDMKRERDGLGLAGSCVTGRLEMGEYGSDRSVSESSIPRGVRFDGLDALKVFRRVELALSELRLSDSREWLVLNRRGVNPSLSFRAMSDELGVSESMCRRYHYGARRFVSAMLLH